jgi:hypothetical protein
MCSQYGIFTKEPNFVYQILIVLPSNLSMPLSLPNIFASL